MRYPDALVTIHIDNATGLEKQDFVGEGMLMYKMMWWVSFRIIEWQRL